MFFPIRKTSSNLLAYCFKFREHTLKTNTVGQGTECWYKRQHSICLSVDYIAKSVPSWNKVYQLNMFRHIYLLEWVRTV